ncbi:hypothetical protein NW766_011037 [Fusarium irregulare]|uniref:Ankyrin n=1 Tax=Fusarium irregulare TaxID=2494466 RepID=A0A9W8PGV7_9HYPO|nr:hypothetical protein NW766_011037 [Fusarium irregulare]
MSLSSSAYEDVTPSPHSSLGGEGLPWFCKWFLKGAIDAAGDTSNKRLMLTHLASQATLSHMSPITSVYFEGWKESSNITTIQPVPTQRAHGNAKYFSVQDPVSAYATALAIHEHLSCKSDMDQFFEFRERDVRCNDITSMLCTFLAQIPISKQSTGRPDSVVNGGIRYHGRSRTLLFNAFHDFLLRNDEGSLTFTWVLLNFNERVIGYRWLMSLLCGLLRDSELDFTLIIVNSEPVDLSDYSDCFESLMIDGRDEVEAKEKLTRNWEDGPDGFAADSDMDVPEVLELLVEFPALYGVRSHLSRLSRQCRDDADLWRLAVAFVRLKATHSAPTDICCLLDRLSPVTPEAIFEHLWNPLQPSSPIKQQIFWATNVLLTSCRPLTLTELYDLEVRTDYGTSIGLSRHSGAYSALSPRTASILQGIVCVRHGEVWFSHNRFWDWVQSRIKQESEDPNSNINVNESEAHYTMAEWCVQRIQIASKEEWAQCQTEDEGLALPESRNTFLTYAVKYWPHHANTSGRGVEQLLFPGSHDAIQNWTKAYWSLSGPMDRVLLSDMTPLTVLAGFGSELLVTSAIDINSVDFSSSCGKMIGAFAAAMRSGNWQIVQRLLALYPQQNNETINDLVLCSFASEIPEAVFWILQTLTTKHLHRLTDPIATLGWAAYHGLEKAVEMLIPIVPSKAVKQDGYLPIYLALRSSKVYPDICLRIIDRLIKAGYPLKGTLPNKEDSNAFVEACKIGNRELAASLVEYLPHGSLTVAGESELPTGFLDGIEAAMTNGHLRVVDGLLQLALAKHWTQLSAIGDLISGYRYATITPLCYKALISHLFTLMQRSPELSTEGQHILYNAFKEGSFFILPQLLELPLGPMVTEFPDMLNRIIVSGNGASFLPSLLESGKMAFDPRIYEETLASALGLAVDQVMTNVVEELLKNDPPLNTRSFNNCTPLFTAAYSGNVDLASILIAAGADVNAEGNELGWTALHAAYDNADMARVLLQAHADVNAKEPAGRTALFYACQNGYTETAKVLLEYEAQIETVFEGNTELSIAVRGSHTQIVALLLASGAGPRQYSATDLETPLLHTCVKENDAKTLEALLLHDVFLDEKADGHTPLHCVTYSTNVELVQLLINRGASLETANDWGWTPLAWATGSSNYEVAEWLIKKGANLAVHVESFGSLMHIACNLGNLKTVKLLRSKGVDINSNDPGISGTPLHALFRRSNDDQDKSEIFEYLINQPDLIIDQSSAWWGSHLSTACLFCDLSMARTLVAKGVDVNATDKMGRLPIHFALYRDLQYVQLLQENGADLKPTDSMRRCALHFAVVSGRLDVVKHVLKYDKSMVNRRDIDNWTPLMWAVRLTESWGVDTTQRADIIKELINNGADLTLQGQGFDRAWTARKIACYHGLDNEIVDLVSPEEESTWARRGYPRKARKADGGYCDFCLMDCWGVWYMCDTCPDFTLCFKCYRSRDTVHPEHLFHNSDGSPEYEDESSPAGTAHSYSSTYSKNATDSSDSEGQEEPEE